MGSGPFPWIACKPSDSDQSLVAALTMSHDQPLIDTEQEVSTLLMSLGLLQSDSRLTGFRQQEIAHAVLRCAGDCIGFTGPVR